MLPMTSLQLAGCTRTCTHSQPCTFKQQWFSDIPFMIATDTQDCSLAVTVRGFNSIFQFMKRNLLNSIWRRSYNLFLLHFHFVNVSIFCSTYISRFEILLSIKFSNPAGLKRQVRPKRETAGLANLPSELRLKIFKHLVEGEPMRVVGYRDGDKDGFLFKERGKYRSRHAKRHMHPSRHLNCADHETRLSTAFGHVDMQAILHRNA